RGLRVSGWPAAAPRPVGREAGMTFEKEIAVALEVERVWAFLWDVERVARCLPGCREARAIVPHQRYAAVVSEQVGPFKVRFPLDIRVLEADAPRRLKAEASGRDPAMGSSLRVTLDLLLEANGTGSRLVIHSEVGLAGTLATLGQGIIQQQADGIMTRFAEAMRRELEAEGRAGCSGRSRSTSRRRRPRRAACAARSARRPRSMPAAPSSSS